MEVFEIYVVYVQWPGGGKARPVLIIGFLNTIIKAYAITSQYENKSPTIRSQYYPIIDWQKAGLNLKSYVDTINPLKIQQNNINYQQKVGSLTNRDIKGLIKFLEK